MSAFPRVRRSRSKTAPEADGGTAPPNGTIPTVTADRPDPSSTPSPAPLAAPATVPGPDPIDPSISNGKMLSALSASSLLASNPPLDMSMEHTRDDLDDLPDNRSSSLSELGDASDDHSEPTPRAPTAADLADPDSEAETERLDTTPRKLTRTLTNTSMGSEQLYERTPSKLIHSKTIDQEESPTPALDRDLDDAYSYPISLGVSKEAESLATLYKGEFAGQKRKRSSGASSSMDEPMDEPPRKRSSTARSPALNGSQEAMVDSSEQVDVDVEAELDNAEERISQLAQEEIELEERQADVAAETVSEMATVAKLTKPRKGGRRGKRKADDIGHTSNDAIASTEVQDPEAEGENDDEDSGTRDEEVAKKKSAIDELSKIEKKFKIFREKLCDEQIAQYEQELEMLRQPNCSHPEYLAMIKCIDERRDEKIAYEKQLLRYKQKNLEIITAAERHQLHSQYFQTVRDAREDILSDCNQRIYELQRGRRQLGVEEIEYSMRLPEKRSEQIRHQAAYNLEVSILAGIAKYVGFPAAPEIKPARPSEIDDDLRAMKITTRPVAPPLPYVRPYNRTSAADEAAAEEQFIERTPWANPQHPAHQQSHYGVAGPTRAPSQSYQTPAGQRRMVDVALNGSASTIEVTSNPPSTSNGRMAESESPVLQMKRHPNDHASYLETPVSHPRAFAGLTRESFASNSHMLSSPAPPHVEEEQGVRWGGIRPLNAGAHGGPPGPSIPGRPDAVRVPLTQRSSLGTVSVGSGNGLFGR